MLGAGVSIPVLLLVLWALLAVMMVAFRMSLPRSVWWAACVPCGMELVS